MKPYVVLDKKVGQTPLQCVEEYKASHERLWGTKMTYAGRLDPMAEGKLLVLIGDECKVQEKYHSLDKEYIFEVLLGVESDTADVLGLVSCCEVRAALDTQVRTILKKLQGTIELPYPHFSSRTVAGKPLHTWKLEGTIDSIEIPTKRSEIYKLELEGMRTVSAQEIYVYATEKIETIPPVTEERKALGNDFRRVDIRASWKEFMDRHDPDETYIVLKVRCICSSGTYMRTLAEVIAKELGTCGLAYLIVRSKIGSYRTLPFGLGFWSKLYQ
jgi:tRNA pseudouridine(55) synthase